jgi:hypothetical protein
MYGNMYGICEEYVLHMYGISMELVWNWYLSDFISLPGKWPPEPYRGGVIRTRFVAEVLSC